MEQISILVRSEGKLIRYSLLWLLFIYLFIFLGFPDDFSSDPPSKFVGREIDCRTSAASSCVMHAVTLE